MYFMTLDRLDADALVRMPGEIRWLIMSGGIDAGYGPHMLAKSQELREVNGRVVILSAKQGDSRPRDPIEKGIAIISEYISWDRLGFRHNLALESGIQLEGR